MTREPQTPEERRLKELAVSEAAKTCEICGMNPVGEACYHICPNSNHYYSPEQERADEANYDPQEYYREGGFIDDDPYAYDTPEDHGVDGGDPDDPPVCYMGHTDCYDNHTMERMADDADYEAELEREVAEQADRLLAGDETFGVGWPD